MLKLFVINLASSTARFERVKSRLDQLAIPFERFDAIDGRREPHPLFQRYDDNRRISFRRKSLSTAELGCFASHYLLWQRCIELNEPIIVMEDDVQISEDFENAVTLASKCIGDLHYLRLAGSSLKKAPYVVVAKSQDFSLVDHVRSPVGAMCYMLDPVAAQKFIDAACSWYMAVDDLMDRYWVHGVDCYSLMPFTINVGSSPSDIPRNEKDKKKVSALIRRELNRRLELILRRIYRIIHFKRKDACITRLCGQLGLDKVRVYVPSSHVI